MSNSIRQCVKALDKNKDVRQMLPDYVDKCMHMNYEDAKLKLMMHYYVYYEMVTEGINPYIESARDTTDAVNEIIADIYERGLTKEEMSEAADKLLKLRKNVMDKMQVLTAYVDCFVVYEYVLNRLEYRFSGASLEVGYSDEDMTQEILQKLSSETDQTVRQSMLVSIIEQLPMRMTRKRFFQVLAEGMDAYKGSDKEAVDGQLFMLRTAAMLELSLIHI